MLKLASQHLKDDFTNFKLSMLPVCRVQYVNVIKLPSALPVLKYL